MVEQIAAAGPLEDTAYRFILPTFQGPLDLLLHLIRINEVNITDIPVVEIARQYDAMLNLMKEMNLEVAGEFLVMAATLVYIKSRLLLPADVERIAAGIEEDPRAALARALLEHQRCRVAAERLAEREYLASLVFTRPVPEGAAETEGYLEVSLFDLLQAFRDLLERAGKRAALSLRPPLISLSERIDQVLSRLGAGVRPSLADLTGPDATAEELIVTFLAILELVRMGSVRAWQSRPFGEIHLSQRAS